MTKAREDFCVHSSYGPSDKDSLTVKKSRDNRPHQGIILLQNMIMPSGLQSKATLGQGADTILAAQQQAVASVLLGLGRYKCCPLVSKTFIGQHLHNFKLDFTIESTELLRQVTR